MATVAAAATMAAPGAVTANMELQVSIQHHQTQTGTSYCSRAQVERKPVVKQGTAFEIVTPECIMGTGKN